MCRNHPHHIVMSSGFEQPGMNQISDTLSLVNVLIPNLSCYADALYQYIKMLRLRDTRARAVRNVLA